MYVCNSGAPNPSVFAGSMFVVFTIALYFVVLYAIYQIGCDVEIEVAGGGSFAGAGRVCGNLAKGTHVDIGDMSREWKESEAIETRGFLYECLKGDTSRSAIQVDVAIDGLAVAMQVGGIAEQCIKILGGLTIDQLRWIYSDYTGGKLTRIAPCLAASTVSLTRYWFPTSKSRRVRGGKFVTSAMRTTLPTKRCSPQYRSRAQRAILSLRHTRPSATAVTTPLLAGLT